jgi:hypothetical protein
LRDITPLVLGALTRARIDRGARFPTASLRATALDLLRTFDACCLRSSGRFRQGMSVQ